MSNLVPTYAYEGEQVFAIFEGKVIASGKSVADIEEEVRTHVGSISKQRKRKTATHIITPNGLKGEILNRVKDTWGEEVTVRFENGHTASFHVTGEEEYITQKVASEPNPLKRFSSKLDEDYGADRDSLSKRAEELKVLHQEAVNTLRQGVSYNDQRELDRICVASKHELTQIEDALAYLAANDVEPYQAPKFAAVEQASFGRGVKDNWLSVMAGEVIAEAQATDYEKIMGEGPALFTADLDTGTLADTGSTQEMAQDFIQSKTAAYTGEDVDDYCQQFIARVEVARRHELADRKASMKREAAKRQAPVDVPDESLFL